MFAVKRIRFRDQVAVFFGFEAKPRFSYGAHDALIDRNPDIRARRFLWFAMVLSQLANVTAMNTTVMVVGFAASLAALAIRETPRRFVWRALLLLLTLAAGFVVFVSYGKLIGRDSGIALLFIFGPLKLIEARTPRDYMWVWGLGLVLYVASFFENLGLGAALTLPVIIVSYITALRLFDAPAKEPDAPSLFAHTKTALIHTLMGIPLAAMLFVLFPRAAAPLWGMRDTSTARTGLSEEMQPGEIAQLIQSRETAFRVEFEGTRRPARADLYWRGPVLRSFDGLRWSSGDLGIRGDFTAITPEQVERDAITYTVTLERLDSRWLPVLELPIAFPSGPAIESTAFLSDAQQIGVRRAPNGATAYRVQSIPRPSFSALDGKSLNSELGTGPPSFQPRARAFAATLREQFPDPSTRVRAVLDFFNREQFFYTLNPPLYNQERATSIDRFLFEGRRGFCEHYAGATVFLLRASGIPARVVTGYQGGEMQPSGYMIVRQSDAHAWVEVLLNGNWTRVDPTAAVAPNRVELGLSAALPETEALLLNSKRWFQTEQLTALWENMTFSYTKWVIGFDRDRQRELMRDLGLGNMNPMAAIGWMLIAVSVSGGIVALAWWLARRRSERALDANVQLWHVLRKRLQRAGLSIAPHDTVRAAMDKAAQRWPDSAALFLEFATVYEGNRFAKQTTSLNRERVAALKLIAKQLPSVAALKRSAQVVAEANPVRA